ncbi:hypothetical protein [Pararhizobium mangrovi]|uniref:Uncharacterized protein n=1 Tax=Pararhizobium mangrovi TaxID=2590452 RepID=A0A506U211_9HYPH|nr:hypothetical protein [Pararhizobium mangrovi]TPW25897.1 hypothetical protein FJU11_17180 [Pararhizobium mangrovi]
MKTMIAALAFATALTGSAFAANASDFVQSPRSPEAHDLMPSQKTTVPNVDRTVTGSITNTGNAHSNNPQFDCTGVVSLRIQAEAPTVCK